MVLEVVVIVFVVVFWAVIDWMAVIGFFGALTGERLERCSRCHRFTLTSGGAVHADGCPMSIHEHVAHVRESAVHGLHFGHRLHFGHH